MLLGLLGLGALGGKMIKESSDDAYVRQSAKANGMRWYASSTGFRDVDNNRQVILACDGKLIDVKTGRRY